MATRAGVELSPSTCRIVEIDAGRRRQPGAEIGIRSFAVAPRAGAQAHAALRAIRGRSAAVVVWGAAGDHRQVVVSERSYERMRREALAALNGSGITTHDAMADVAVTPVPPDLSKRRPV